MAFSFLKKKWVLLGIGACIIVGGFTIRSFRVVVPVFSSATVERRDLTQSVDETGQVEATTDIGQGWEVSGRVVSQEKMPGDVLKKGDVVARLESGQVRSRLQEAISAYNSSKALLDLKLVGPSEESKAQSLATIKQAEASVVQYEANLAKAHITAKSTVDVANKALETATNNLQLASGGEESQIVRDAYADLVDVLKSSVTTLSSALTESDNILGVDNTQANDSFESVLSLSDMTFLNSAKQSYVNAKRSKEEAEQLAIMLHSDSAHTQVDITKQVLSGAISDMQIHLLNVQHVLGATSPIGNLTQASLDTLKSTINTTQKNVNTASASFTTAAQGVITAKNSLHTYSIAYDKAVLDLDNAKKQADADVAIAEAQLLAQKASLASAHASYDLLVTTPREVDVASLRADVSRQSASVQSAQEDVRKTELRTLADGVLGKFDTKIGEYVTAGTVVATIVSHQFHVKVDISESDIAKVKMNDSAIITFDAFGDDVIVSGQVVAIDPSQTEISGVVYYKTTVLLDDIADLAVRSGMTANVKILTDKIEQVLVAPRRAVLKKDGKDIVRVVTNKDKGIFEEREVVTGLSGDEGLIEIVSGLEEGQEVVTFVEG